MLLIWDSVTCQGSDRLSGHRAPSEVAGGCRAGVCGRSAGGVLSTETMRVSGLGRALSAAPGPGRKPSAFHHPGKIVADLATRSVVTPCRTHRGAPRRAGVYGLVASDPTVSRLITSLAADADRTIRAISAARAEVRAAASSDAGGAGRSSAGWRASVPRTSGAGSPGRGAHGAGCHPCGVACGAGGGITPAESRSM